MKNHYNLKNHSDLLKIDRDLRAQNTSLCDQNQKAYLKLLNYWAMIGDYIHWKKRKDYLELILHFVQLKINKAEFETRFDKLFTSNENNCQDLENNWNQLKTLNVDPRSVGFSQWVSEIDLAINEFVSREDEKELRSLVENVLSEIIRLYCQEEI